MHLIANRSHCTLMEGFLRVGSVVLLTLLVCLADHASAKGGGKSKTKKVGKTSIDKSASSGSDAGIVA